MPTKSSSIRPECVPAQPGLPSPALSRTTPTDYSPKKTGRPALGSAGASELGGLIILARRLLVEALGRELAPFDISAAQFAILSKLASMEVESTAQLCREICYDPGAMTRMLDRLEAKGLLERIRRDPDRRAVRLELTPRGCDLYPRLEDCWKRVLAQQLKDFTDQEICEFIRFLKKACAKS